MLDHLFLVDQQESLVVEVTRKGFYVSAFSTTPSAPNPTGVVLDTDRDILLVAGANPTGVGSLGTLGDGAERTLIGVDPQCP